MSISLIEADCFLIKHVKNPSLKMCLLAVKRDGLALKYIKKQTEEICIAAVMQNGHALKYVKKQTKSVQYTAIDQEPHAIKHIKTPSFDMYIRAIMKDPRSILVFTKLTAIEYEVLMNLALQKNGLLLAYCNTQTEEMCISAIKQNYQAFVYVKTQTYKLCIIAIRLGCNRIIPLIKRKNKRMRNLIVYNHNTDTQEYSKSEISIKIRRNGVPYKYSGPCVEWYW
jgi:hypothetical protein